MTLDQLLQWVPQDSFEVEWASSFPTSQRTQQRLYPSSPSQQRVLSHSLYPPALWRTKPGLLALLRMSLHCHRHHTSSAENITSHSGAAKDVTPPPNSEDIASPTYSVEDHFSCPLLYGVCPFTLRRECQYPPLASWSALLFPLAFPHLLTPSKLIVAIVPAISSVEDLAHCQYSSEYTACLVCPVRGITLLRLYWQLSLHQGIDIINWWFRNILWL